MLGDKIKQIRKDKKISQKDFAEILEIPVSTLANYENNHREPNIDTLKKISNALGISPVELFPNNNTDETPEEGSSYIGSSEFEKITGAYVLQNASNEKNNTIIPFIKYINEHYLKSKYNIDKLLYTNTEDLLSNKSNYADLKFLLIDIIDIRLNRYYKVDKLLSGDNDNKE